MLDSDKKAVMSVLRELTGQDDTYKVIEADEILERLPAEIDLDKQKLSVIIRDLRDREYLKVKYFTPDEYCLLTLKRTEELAQMVAEVTAIATKDRAPEPVVAEPAEKPAKKKEHGKLSVALYAFLGGLLGGGIVTIISVIIQALAF